MKKKGNLLKNEGFQGVRCLHPLYSDWLAAGLTSPCSLSIPNGAWEAITDIL